MKKMKFNKLFAILFLCLFAQSLASNDDDDFEDPIVSAAKDSDNIEPEEKEKYVPPQYQTPNIDKTKTKFLELFDKKGLIGKTWLKSESKKEGAEEAISKYDGEWSIGLPSEEILAGDYGLIVRTKARHHAIAAKLQTPFEFTGKALVLQYEVKYEQGQECGGGYLKLLTTEAVEKLRDFNDKSPYVIMFGPDKCGMSSKIHFIIRHKNPKNGTVSEHHAKQSSKSLTNYFEDKKTHLYTLVINPDNTFRVSVDKSELISGNLLNDLEPPVIPPKEIPDPQDKKPADWDDRAVIEDKDAKKPEDWDENQPKEVLDEEAVKPTDWLEEEEPLIADETAAKPEDWDDEMDGEYEPRKVPNPKCEGRSGCGKWKRPMKANPLYKGKWSPPKITNPNYKGVWSPQLIENPHYFETIALEPIGAVGIELWTMSSNIVFDNIIITDDESVAKALAEQTFDVKKAQEKVYQTATSDSKNIFKSVLEATEEKPWLWAVIIAAVLVPIILISVFCFGRKSSKSADRKKTDEPVEDEEVEEMEAVHAEDRPEEGEGDHTAQEFEPEEVGADQNTDESQHSSASSSSAGSKPPTPTPGTPAGKNKKKGHKATEQQPKAPAAVEEQQPDQQPTTSASPTRRRVRARRQE